jgi:putative ABC transport system permease protein
VRTLRPAWWLLRDVTLPSIRQHRLRAVLALTGVLIGTQMVVAIGLLNRGILHSFERTLETVAAGAALQVSNGSVGVGEELIERLAAVPGVESASGLIQGTLATWAGGLTAFGVDLFEDQRVREVQFPREHVHIPDELAFVNALDSIAVSTSFAEEAGLSLGSSLEVVGPAGRTALAVRGFLDPVGPAALFGGAVALLDLPAAQRLFESEGRVDQIDLALAPGADIEAVAAEITRVVGGAGSVERPRERGANLGGMLAGVHTIFTLSSLIGLIVGALLIHQTLGAAIFQRRRELALARAVGYDEGVIATAVLIEAALFGLAGALLGTAVGLAAARLSADLVTEAIAAIYARTDRIVIAARLTDVVLALALGLGAALAAAVAPARRAARLSVVEELRETREWRAQEAPAVRPLLGGALLVAGGAAIFLADLRPSHFAAQVGLIIAGVIVVTIGYALVAPWVLRGLARGLARVARRLARQSALLAAESVARAPARSRGTVAALMVAFAMVILVNAFVRSLRESILTWVDQTFAADFFISGGPELPLPSGPALSGDIEAELRELDGVAEVSAVRMVNVRVGDALAILKTHGAGAFRRHRFPVVAAAEGSYFEAFARGDAVLVSDNLAYRRGLRPGETLTLETPAGRASFAIAAVVVDYTLDIGTVIVERETYKRLWRDDRANAFLVWLSPGASREALRAALAERLIPRYRLVLMTGREFGETIAGVLDRALLLTYAIELVAIAVAVIGVVNFFLAELVDRRREIGLLRTVAFGPAQIVEGLAWEAALLGLAGGLLAVLYAWPLSFLIVTRSTRLVSGWALTFDFPVLLAAATVVLVILASVAAAYHPARLAARRSVAELVGVES